MKASELRIGNWVQVVENILDYLTPGYEFQWSLDYFYSLEKGYCNEDCFAGIPITEEWMVKLGFKKINKDKYSNEHWINNGDLTYYLDVDKLTINDEAAYCTITTCKFVHELQNLYFALTGEELTAQ